MDNGHESLLLEINTPALCYTKNLFSINQSIAPSRVPTQNIFGKCNLNKLVREHSIYNTLYLKLV